MGRLSSLRSVHYQSTILLMVGLSTFIPANQTSSCWWQLNLDPLVVIVHIILEQ